MASSSLGSESFTRGFKAEGEDFEDGGSSPAGVLPKVAAVLVGAAEEAAAGGLVSPEDLDRMSSSSPTLAVGLADRSLTAWARASMKCCSSWFSWSDRYSRFPLFAGALVENSARTAT